MFSRVKNFLSNHKKKFIISGVIIGGSYLLKRYFSNRLRDWQEQETKNIIEQSKKQIYFGNIEQSCNTTALLLSNKLGGTINGIINIDSLLAQLRSGSCANKVAIWKELKVLSFTKLVAIIYTNAMLMVTLKIQLNVYGGYMYRNTTGEDEVEFDPTQGEKYLSLCKLFIEDGIKEICCLIENHVRVILENRALTEKLSLHDVEQIFWSIQTSISCDNSDPVKILSRYTLPNDLDNWLNGQTPSALSMMIETQDLLEDEEITALTTSCVSRGFSYVVDLIANYYTDEEKVEDIAGPSTRETAVVNVTKSSKPLAKVIPLVSGIAQVCNNGSGDSRRSWMEQLIMMEKLKVLGANIYEAFSNKG